MLMLILALRYLVYYDVFKQHLRHILIQVTFNCIK